MPLLTTRCVICTKTAEIGLLCGRHHNLLATWLADVIDTYALLDDVIDPGSVQAPSDSIRARGRGEPPVPLRLDVVALRDHRNRAALTPDEIPSAPAVVGSWARVVREERDLATPTSAATVAGDTDLLITHLDWIAAQMWVDEFHAEIRQLRRALLNAVGEYAPRPLGRCPTIDLETSDKCGGALLADRWGGLSVTCRRCGEHWDQAYIERATELLEKSVGDPC